MKKLFFLACILIMLVGCATPNIIINGAPADSNMMFFRSGDFLIYVHAKRHYVVKEGNEEFTNSESIEFNKLEILRSNTAAVTIDFRIVNRNKHHYQIYETNSFKNKNNKYKNYHKKIYDGKLSRNDVRIKCPIMKTHKGVYRLELFDDKGLKCFICSLNYEWVVGGNNI